MNRQTLALNDRRADTEWLDTVVYCLDPDTRPDDYMVSGQPSSDKSLWRYAVRADSTWEDYNSYKLHFLQ